MRIHGKHGVFTALELGSRHGRLTVVDWTVRRDGRLGRAALCQCDCGKTCSVLPHKLLRGHTVSCGCRRIEAIRANRLANGHLVAGEAAFNHLVAQYQLGAKRRGHTWNLNRDQVRSLFRGDCFYCRQIPATECTPTNGSYGSYIYNGIDRVDNDKGYEPENCVSCCGRCNRMKGATAQGQFLAYIAVIAATHGMIGA